MSRPGYLLGLGIRLRLFLFHPSIQAEYSTRRVRAQFERPMRQRFSPDTQNGMGSHKLLFSRRFLLPSWQTGPLGATARSSSCRRTSRAWAETSCAVQPDTLLRWHPEFFRCFRRHATRSHPGRGRWPPADLSTQNDSWCFALRPSRSAAGAEDLSPGTSWGRD
jgi:hypothetical protein